ncbi:uncharacterized protein BXZ73DRAFT_90402 [Epithele typhae]|uniref:uncharacterized protein n=1 Tax=Epithele typhae TaxID=378194 RepID=UPI0020086C5C|nr:uncharacterized protein BXZ73DRAFT_90402 [Epithele typhae]KAH9929550.1 hypothetical protein BXZ73DRAFT_90402 [Epithele typhae]
MSVTPVTQDDDFASRAFADAIKANDPAQHRASLAASQLSPTTSTSFGLSISSAGIRPSSSASSSSAVSAGRTPSSKAGVARPPSRTSEVFARSASRAGSGFDVGDNVRIESLGFEGALRYLGEIDGKPGMWAGVELGGGFAGKGKNNGSVAGKQYFTCPPNCGVFVASTKLSPPPLDHHGPSTSGRVTPSMMTSLGNGRKTPSISNGRVTPSMSNGRVTPAASTGRRTPSNLQTPSARPRTSTVTRSVVTPGRTTTTAKYLAKTPGSPSRSSTATLGSPRQPARNLASPTRSTPALGTIRPSNIGMGLPTSTTPSKPRLPSAIAMPPPPLLLTQRILAVLLLSTCLPQPFKIASPRPDSRVSTADSAMALEMQNRLDVLQARLNTTKNENERFRSEAEDLRKRVDGSEREASARIESLVAERDQLQQNAVKVSELEAAARSAERSLSERDAQIETLQRAVEEAAKDVEKARSDGDARLRDAQNKLEDKEALVAQLKEAVEAREGEQSENADLLKAKNGEIALLEARVQKAYAELEEERRELGAQVDELRKAGQETIALYEERLNAADSKRYELEDLVISLEEQVKAAERPVSPGAAARQAESAAQIENEMLRGEVQHLQKKISTLEDTLEEMRVANESDDAAVRDRIKRYKDRDENIRKELTDARQEVERVRKAEERARLRVEEIEEALRENTVTLENAQTEIETLRGEIAVSDLFPRHDVLGLEQSHVRTSRVLPQRPRVTRLISSARCKLAHAIASAGGADPDELHILKEDKDVLQQSLKRTQTELADERAIVEELRVLVNERSVELDTLRKKLNRDGHVNGGELKAPPSPASKHDLSAARDEITGLKHIVQELQKESTILNQRNKVLEAENRLLLSETEQLREDLKILEDDVEKSLSREEALANGEHSPPPGTPSMDDIQALQRSYKDLKTKYETEVEQLKKKLADIEMKHARQVHDLNKEIGELESLIESKIYREDELEAEIDRLKEKLAKSQKKLSKNDLPEEPLHRPASSASTMSSVGQSGEEVCEICERPGHDIFTCDLLKEGAPPPSSASSHFRRDEDEAICEDCEERGHTAANCPHSLDVF